MNHDEDSIVSQMRILYVEDDADTNEAMSAFLKRKAAVVHSTTNGEYGLQLFKDKKIDLVITDIKMPHMDGLEMVRGIKAIDSEVKVIFISAYHEQNLFLQAINLRAEGFLTKPVSPGKDLLPLIGKLGKYETLKEFTAEYPDMYKIFDKSSLEGPQQWQKLLQSGHTFKIQIKDNIFLAKPNTLHTEVDKTKYVVNFTDITHLENKKNSIIKNAARDTHTARWGGGVFSVLGTHNAIAGELAQKIQDQITSADFDPALQIDAQFYKIDSNKPLWELLQED